MSTPSSGEIRISQIRNEIGASGQYSLGDAAAADLNNCSPGSGDTSPPYNMSNWYSYDDDAPPSAPTISSVTIDTLDITDANKDTQIKVTWGAVTCATDYSITGSYNSDMSSPTLTTTTTSLSYIDTGLTANTIRYFKVAAFATGTAPSGGSGTANGTTGPTSPLSFADNVAQSSGSTNDYTVKLEWSNGTRSMSGMTLQRRINGGSWSTITAPSAGDEVYHDQITSAGLSDGDTIDHQIRYSSESTSTWVSSTHTAIIPI